eukprot:10492197-Prorocentrum_lima.AAC.1
MFVALDAKNACGTMSRKALAHVIHNDFPELNGLTQHLPVPMHQAYGMDSAGKRHPVSLAT